MGSYSLTRGQTQAQCIGIADSKALNHQRSPYVSLSFLFSFLSFTFFVKSKRWKVEPRPALPPTHTHPYSYLYPSIWTRLEKNILSDSTVSFYLFICYFYFLLHWVFTAVYRLSLIAGSEGYSLVAMDGLLLEVASPVAKGPRVCRLSSSGTRAYLSCGIWDPSSGTRDRSLSPSLTGRFLTPRPPR